MSAGRVWPPGLSHYRLKIVDWGWACAQLGYHVTPAAPPPKPRGTDCTPDLAAGWQLPLTGASRWSDLLKVLPSLPTLPTGPPSGPLLVSSLGWGEFGAGGLGRERGL